MELKEILAINPSIKVIAAPWTCPKWMKVKSLTDRTPLDSWTNGQLNPDYYQDYATISKAQMTGQPLNRRKKRENKFF